MSTHRFVRHVVAVGATTLVTVSMIVGAAAPASAHTTRQRATGDTATTLADPSRTIVATGTARVRGTPDVLTVMLGVTSRGHTVGEALDRNNTAARKVLEVLLDGGVDKKDLQTTNFSIGPIYGDNGSDIQGYQVSNVVVAQLRDLDKAGGLLDKAAQAGGDDVVVRNVSFDLDDTGDLVAAARADAVKRARNQADQLATAAGVQLGDVLTISESSPDVGPVLAAPEAADGRAASSVPIQSGSEELTVQVSVVFSIR
jgi:uncharacterized protein YggE